MIYGAGSIVLKLINFILIPVYTRFITPNEYGLLAITSSVLAVFMILYSLEMRGAINFFYTRSDRPEIRNRNISSIWLAMISFALLMAVLFDTFGEKASAILFISVPYSPYIRIVIWTAFFTVFSQVPQVLYQVKESPIPYVILLVANALLNIGLSVYFIVVMRLGALGYLLGAFISSFVMSVPYLIITLRMIRPSFGWRQLVPILAYSMPLVLHSLSAWLLEYSDRLIMEKFIPLSQIGIYSLGFQFGAIVNLFSTAVNTAWVPLIFRLDSQDPEHSKARISRLVTYLITSVAFIFIILIIFVREINSLATPPEYKYAYQIAYWVALGQLFHGLYYIPVNFLFLRGKTKFVPLITIGSAVIDVFLNIALLPHFGVIAAAWAGCFSKMIMLTLALLISHRVYPFKYEVNRLVKLIIIVTIIFFINLLMPEYSLGLSLTLKSMLVLVTIPILFLANYFTQEERLFISSFFRSLLHRNYFSITL